MRDVDQVIVTHLENKDKIIIMTTIKVVLLSKMFDKKHSTWTETDHLYKCT